MKKSEKRVRFCDEVAVTGVIRKKPKRTEHENFENSKESSNFEVLKKRFENPVQRTCYTPEREGRVCPNFNPELDFSIDWAKKFLKNIAM